MNHLYETLAQSYADSCGMLVPQKKDLLLPARRPVRAVLPAASVVRILTAWGGPQGTRNLGSQGILSGLLRIRGPLPPYGLSLCVDHTQHPHRTHPWKFFSKPTTYSSQLPYHTLPRQGCMLSLGSCVIHQRVALVNITTRQ